MTITPLTSPTPRPTAMPATMATAGEVEQGEVRRGHAGQRVDGADRQVDPPGHQHQRAGRGDDQRRGLLVEDVEQVDLGEERPAGHGQHDEQDEERVEDPGPAQRAGQRAADGRSDGRPRPVRACVRSCWSITHLPSCIGAEGRPENRRFGHGLAAELGGDPAGPHHQHAVGEPEDLLGVGGDEQHAEALGRQRGRAARRWRAWRRRPRPWSARRRPAHAVPAAGSGRT